MDKNDRFDRILLKYIIIGALLFSVVLNYQIVLLVFRTIWDVIAPIVYGFIVAFILNLIMVKIESVWFKQTTNTWLIRLRRPMSVFISVLIVLFVIVIVLWLVIPQLISVVRTVIELLPVLVSYGQNLFTELGEVYPELNTFMGLDNYNWENIAREIATFANNLLGSTFSTIGTLSSSLFNLVIILVIAIYTILSKERILNQFRRLGRAYLKQETYHRLGYLLSVTNESFSNFMTSMLIEAIIYGSLVTVGMWIFRFPYAGMIGTLSGVLALIPMVGAIVSAVIGVLLVSTQSLSQGFLFLIFNVIIQQVESNVIYPRVVGGSIGLPGIWTFIAVTIGGSLLGPVGFFIGVPVASTVYKLIENDVQYREQLEGHNTITSLKES